MHPIEHLRYVAREQGIDPSEVTAEAASALAGLGSFESAALVPAFRRLLERHIVNGSLWTLASRMLLSDEPTHAAREMVAEMNADRTVRHLVNQLPEEATVLMIGWPTLISGALRSRGDLEILVADNAGEGYAFARRLTASGSDATVVPDRGVAAAASVADLVLLETPAAGPGGFLAAAGSTAAASVASGAGVPVWLAAGAGSVLAERLYNVLLERLDEEGEEPWDRDFAVCPPDLVSVGVGPGGVGDGASLLNSASTAVPAELLGRWS